MGATTNHPFYNTTDIDLAVLYHLTLHPSLESLLERSMIDAAYIGGSLSRVGTTTSTDLDIFLVISSSASLRDFTKLLNELFCPPTYYCSPASFLSGFGSFYKILHPSNPIDLFVNSSSSLIYNPMMSGNIILFDRTGLLTKTLNEKNESHYFAERKASAIADSVYYSNLMRRKFSKGKEVAAVRAYYRAVHAFVDLHAFQFDQASLPFIGINEDLIQLTLLSEYGIDYLNPSGSSIQNAARVIRNFFAIHHQDYLELIDE